MTPADPDNLRVLVVDHDGALLSTLAPMLRERGYEAVAAATGRDGLRLAAEGQAPAVALVDLELPDMDGVEVISRLHALSPLTETVALTEHASIDSAIRALREHSYDYLVKPVTAEQLVPILQRAGDRWRRQAQADLRRTEERYRLLLENINDVVAVMTPDRRVQYVSPAVTRVLGYDAETVKGADGTFPIHPDDQPAYISFLYETLAEPDATGTFVARVRHRDGSWRQLELTAKNLIHRPEFGGWLFIVRDVTERRRLEAQVHQSQKMESIGSLAGGVAHDFNNVLTAIIGYGELILANPELEPTVREDVEEMIRAGERATALTRQLLAFSRRQPTEPRLLDLNGLVEELLKMLRRLITENVELQTHLEPGVWSIRADPTQVEQVLVNLTVNARDAMPGGGTLDIATTNTVIDAAQSQQHGVPAGQWVLLTVRDTGTGMTEDVKARAFEPFYTTKGPGKGTGLGLSTSYGIVKQSGGQIVIDSTPGQGTTIAVYFPRAEGHARKTAPASAGAADQAHHECVLIVDDDAQVRALIARTLTTRGYQALQAEDADSAIGLVRRGEPAVDLLLTDVVLAGESGVELARRMASEFPRIRRVFMSGYQDRPIAQNEPLPDPQGILQKPFTPSMLVERVRRALDSRG